MLAKFMEKMATYGISLENLGGKAKTRRGRKPKVAKADAAAGKAKVKPAKVRKREEFLVG